MHKKLLLVTLLGALSVQGCVFVAGAAAGSAVVYDRRELTTIKDDEAIRFQIIKQINNDSAFHNSHIVISSYDHNVLLAGQTPQADLKAKVEQIAREQGKVEKVYNQITVEPPTSNMTRASDAWITTKIKSQMLATKGLRSGEIKVVTEDSTVFLIGKVTAEQADLAVSVAKEVDGVQKVVKVFQ